MFFLLMGGLVDVYRVLSVILDLFQVNYVLRLEVF